MTSKYLRTDDTTNRVVGVTFERETDTDPDLSFLGKYASSPGKEDRTIDRQARGDQGQRELRFFIAALSGEETGNPESVEHDYQRAQEYNRQIWSMTFCRARARISMNGVLQFITETTIPLLSLI